MGFQAEVFADVAQICQWQAKRSKMFKKLGLSLKGPGECVVLF